METALDVAGIEIKKSLQHMATTPEKAAQVDAFINEFRGLISTAKLGVGSVQRQVETAAILAPRYNRAIAALMFDVFNGNLRGKLARDAFIKTTAGTILTSIAISIGLGERDPKQLARHLNPADPDFLTWEIAGQRVGPGSKVRSVLRMIGQFEQAIAKGEPERLISIGMDNPGLAFIRGNLSPVVGSSLDLLSGENYIGDPTRQNMLQFSKEILAKNLLPLTIQSALFEGTGPMSKAVLSGGQFVGLRTIPESEWDLVVRRGDDLGEIAYGKKWAELNNGQKRELRFNNPDFAEKYDKTIQDSAAQDSPFAAALETLESKFKEERKNNIELAAQSLKAGKISKYEFDKIVSRSRSLYTGSVTALISMREQLGPKEYARQEKRLLASRKPEDAAVDQYYQWQDELLDKEISPDWDKVNAELAKRMKVYPEYIRQYVEAQKNAWMFDLGEQGRQIMLAREGQIENGKWWDNYRGETKGTNRLPRVGETSGTTRLPRL